MNQLHGFAAFIEKKISKMVEKSLRKQSLRTDLPSGSKASYEEIHEAIENYARTSAAIAAGFSLIPGPLGILAMYQEMQSILNTQIDMIAYLTLRLHKREQVNHDLIFSILATSIGNVGISLLTSEGGQLILERLTQRLTARVAEGIGKSIATKTSRHFAAKWVPLLGSGMMYLYTLHATRHLGWRAAKLLQRGIILEGEMA